MATCALVGASDFNVEHFKQMDARGCFDYVIGVDGGLTHLEGIERVPDMALGDFDSLGYVPTDIPVERFPVHKDATDMELALDRAYALNYNKLYLYGALGKRLDHTLANLQVCSLFSERGLSPVIIDNTTAATFITGSDTFEMSARDCGTVSVFSMSDRASGVFEHGLEYKLDNADLTNRTSLGLSNEFIGESVAIGVESGTLVIFTPL